MMSKAGGLTPNWCRRDEQNKCRKSRHNRVYTSGDQAKLRSKPNGWKRTREANESLTKCVVGWQMGGLEGDIPADSSILKWTVEHAGYTLLGKTQQPRTRNGKDESASDQLVNPVKECPSCL